MHSLSAGEPPQRPEHLPISSLSGLCGRPSCSFERSIQSRLVERTSTDRRHGMSGIDGNTWRDGIGCIFCGLGEKAGRPEDGRYKVIIWRCNYIKWK